MASRTLADLIKVIDQHRAEIRCLMKAANLLASAQGTSQPYAIEEPIAPFEVPPHYFLRVSNPSTAIKKYLKLKGKARGPASVDELFTVLVHGGYSFTGQCAGAAKRGMAIAISKCRALRRLPNGYVGLTEWYPRAKGKKSNA